MSVNRRLTEAETLELYRVALENTETQTEIAAAMAEMGYDSTAIAEGKTLLAVTRATWDTNKTEDDESSAAYDAYLQLREQLADTYALHRKKAKVIYRNDHLTAEKLGLTGQLPQAYMNWLETVRKFYTVAAADTAIQTALSRLKVTPEELSAATALIAQLEAARSDYLREKGESQDATKAKDAAFNQMDDWMSEFYAVARIALNDKPQLLESIGKFVRS